MTAIRKGESTMKALVLIAALLALPLPVFPQDAGKVLYDQWCSSCHGEKGDGRGPAYDFVWPKPRDFTKGTYKFKSTGSGEPPVDADIVRTIREGNPGTTMPAWPRFTDSEVASIVVYLKQFSPDTFSIKGTSVKIGTPPGGKDKMIALGKEMYQTAKCWECHGKAGRGDGEKGWQEKFKDDWGNRIFPADQTSPWEYRAGSDLKDVFKTITVGLDGTPMTSYGDTVPEEKRWALAYFVVSQEQARNLGLALRVKKVNRIPETTEDQAWDKAEYLDIPLAGQVIFDPRDFTTPLTNARIRGMYTGSDIAVMIEWTDKQENKGGDGLPPDAARIAFPAKETEAARPYFFMGDKKLAVNVWQWKDSESAVAELIAAGPDAITPAEQQNIRMVASRTDGRYRILFKRALASGFKNETGFEAGKFIPFAVTLYDGRNNEENKKGAISAWYYLVLEPPVPLKVYVFPAAMFLVFLGAGYGLHRTLGKTA